VNLAAAGTADAEALGEVHAAAFAAPWAADDIRQLLEQRGAFGLAAREGDAAICGFILARVIAGEAEVLTIAVRPEHRRCGVARALLAAAEGLAKVTADAIFLEVAADNAGAIALYEGAGYERVGRRARYYARPSGDGADAIVMRRALNR
jgi:ribosomal-protein-alanine N-acetyltransferase